MMKPTYEPIRKPTPVQPRGAKLIELLCGRLVRSSNGNIYAATRLVDAHRLYRMMLRWSKSGKPRNFSNSLSPVPTGALVRVTNQELHLAISAVCTMARREWNRLTSLTAEQCLERLGQLRTYLEHSQTNSQKNGAWELLCWDTSPNASPWGPLVQWLGGDQAITQWRAGMESLHQTLQRPTWWNHARRSVALLDQFIQDRTKYSIFERAERAHGVFVHAIELAQSPYHLDIDTTYPDLTNGGRTAKKWGKRLRKSITQKMELVEHTTEHCIPAALACWVTLKTANRSSERLIHSWLEDGKIEHVDRFFRVIGGLSENQQSKLIAVCETFKEIPTHCWYDIARSRLPMPKLLKRLQGGYYYDLSPRSRRSEIQEKARRITGQSMGRYDQQESLVYRAWCKWAKQWPRSIWSKESVDAWSGLLSEIHDLASLDKGLSQRWSGWLGSLDGATRKYSLDINPLCRTDHRTKRVAHSLLVFRRIGREKTKWPKQIRQRLERKEKWQQELQYLEACEQAQQLTERSKARLEYLRHQTAPKLPALKPLRKRIEVAALEASHTTSRKWTIQRRRECLRKLGASEQVFSSHEKAAELIKLFATLPESSRQLLLVGLRASFGKKTGYKTIGQANAQWIQTASRSNVDVGQWLQPVSMPINLPWVEDGKETAQPMTIGITSLAEHVLWMGRPFDSCLDLRGGIYCESVVPNFLDANKQLLVLLDSQNRMVGRKLLAISSDFGLVGYRLYLATSGDHAKTLESTQKKVLAFCQSLATRTGIALADEGTPCAIHGKSWYDDGTVPWTPLEHRECPGNTVNVPGRSDR
ncbi:hypothetical protein [Planctomycetes bacterium CA13]